MDNRENILREYVFSKDDYPTGSIGEALKNFQIDYIDLLQKMSIGNWDFEQFVQEPIGIDEII